MPTIGDPPWERRRRHRPDPLLVAIITVVLALALALTQPVEPTDGSSQAPHATADLAVHAVATSTKAAAPDQWTRGVSLEVERIRPAPTSTPQPPAPPQQEGLVAVSPTGAPAAPQAGGGGAAAPTAQPERLSTKVPEAVRRFEKSVLKWSAHHNLDPHLIAALIMTESEGNPNAVSPRGAIGLMQVMGGPFDPDENIRVGTGEFAGYLGKYGVIDLALAAYNAGPGAVDRYGGIPPYQETRAHVFRVQVRYRMYTSP